MKNQPYNINGKSIIPVLAHAPHGGTFIPSNIKNTLALTEDELRRERILMTNNYTPELFSSILNLGGAMMINNFSRLVIDPERFENEKKEIMILRP